MSLFETLKIVHILAAIAWIGGALMLSVLFARTRSASDTAGLTNLLDQSEFLGRAYFNPAGILTLVAGVWMVIEGDFEFSEAWISIGFLGIIAGVVLGAAYYPRQIRAARSAIEGGSGLSDSGVSGPLDKLRLATSAELLLLAFVVWAMVVKPGA